MKIKTAGERCGECFIEGTGEDRTCKFHERDGQEACIGLKLYQEGQRSVTEAVLPVIEFYADSNSYRSKHGGHIENKNFRSGIGQDCGEKAREVKEQLEKLLKELN